ncbi:MAG: sigma-70 family RNA polymerase sigma factor, partial [Paludibacteraceae bacterium]|nr:sigma-70 family RNA polymerase sigma factor [Paludibacteraceae bacterium]
AFTPEELTAYEMEAQSGEEFLEESRRAEHHKLDMMEKELQKLSDKETALLMAYYETDGSKTSMKRLAEKMGYSCDRVAITIKSRILKKLRNGIQQQERAYGDGLSPVALFYLFQVIRYLIITELGWLFCRRLFLTSVIGVFFSFQHMVLRTFTFQ